MFIRRRRALTTFLASFVLGSGVLAGALVAMATPASASMATEVILYSAGINSLAQGSNQDIGCIGGSHGVNEPALLGVIAVANGCGTRVWLHQYSDGSGWAYCVSPYQYDTLPGWAQFPQQLLISANTAGCNSGSMATEVMLYGNADDQAIGCIGGSHGVLESNLFGVNAVANGCGTRVWLHQYSDGSGWSYCVSPRSYSTVPGWAQWPAQLLISANTAGC
jgi:hypothetical protein